MHRRITTVIEYQPPSAAMRTDIWRNLLFGTDAATGTGEGGGEGAGEGEGKDEGGDEGGSKRGDAIAIAVASAGSGSGSGGGSRLRLADDVDIAAIAAKYELVRACVRARKNCCAVYICVPCVSCVSVFYISSVRIL